MKQKIIYGFLGFIVALGFNFGSVILRAQLAEQPVISSQTEALPEFQQTIPAYLTKNKIEKKTTYTNEELILIELKSINEKLGNIQLNTYKR